MVRIGEGGRLLGLPKGLDGGHLHGLRAIHELALRVSTQEDQHAGNQTHDGGDLEGSPEDLQILACGPCGRR